MSDDELKAIRQRIDELDVEIQRLIVERAAMARSVADIKSRNGERQYYRPEREAEILRKVRERDCGDLAPESVEAIFREIISACLALEQPLRVGYLGPAGTFTQLAVGKHFGSSVESVPLGAIDEVFREVESGQAHFGVVPVENSTEGVVSHTLDRFLDSPLQVCGEIMLRVHHQLLSRCGSLTEVQQLYAHEQTLAQCRQWLNRNLPSVPRVPVSSNAEAARRAAGESGAAAIASDAAAEIYELGLLARNIEDAPENTTRFLVIGPQSAGPSGSDKTSLVVSRSNEPGALYRLLAPFATHGVNITRIEARPAKGAIWEYVFFMDLLGHARDSQVAAALAEVAEQASMLRVLGSYPRAYK